MHSAILKLHESLEDMYVETKRYTFSEVDFYGQRHEGTCGAWSETMSSASTYLVLNRATAMVFSSVHTPPNVFTTADLTVADYEPYTARCLDDDALERISERLLSVTDTAYLEIQCSGRLWKVATCEPHPHDSGQGTAICVDCVDPCGDVSRCTAYNGSSYALAPCSRGGCTEYISTHGLVENNKAQALSIYFSERYPAPAFLSMEAITAASPSTSLNLSLVMDSSDGTVYCGLFEHNRSFVPMSVQDMLIQNNAASIASNMKTFVVVGDLVPATVYDVYCVAYSSYGVVTTVDSMLSNGIVASTACCKELKVTFADGLYENSNHYDFIKLSSRSGFSGGLEVSLGAQLGGVPQVDMFVPSTVRISGTASSASSLYSSLKAASEGVYTLEVTLAGADAASWSVVYPAGQNFTLLSTEVPQSAPTLESAKFSDDGTSITVTLSRESNYGGLSRVFACSELFAFYEPFGGNLIDTKDALKCVWLDAETVKIRTEQDASLHPEVHELHVLAGNDLSAACDAALTNDCDIWPRVNTSSDDASDFSVLISTADSPVSPVVSISSPSTVGSCDDFVLDISSSSGSGGRAWRSVTIIVTSTGSSTNTSAVQAHVDSVYEANRATTIPYALLAAGLSYGFEVSLCNFLGECSSGSHRCTKVATIMPALTIYGSALRSGLFRPTPFSISGTATYLWCEGDLYNTSMRSITLSTEWRVYLDDVLQSDIVSISAISSKFSLPAYSLTTARIYVIEYRAILVEDGVSRTASSEVTLYVQRSDIVAVVSNGLDRNLPLNASIQIDASSSYDLDYPELAPSEAGLSFRWTCLQLEPISEVCEITMTDLGDGILQVFAGATSGATMSQISMTVSDGGTRSQDKTILVKVITPYQPVVKLASSTVIESANNKIRPSVPLRLQASVDLIGSGQCEWTIDDDTISLADVALVPTVRDLMTTGTRSLAFVVGAYTLPVDVTLVFTLSCTQYSMKVGDDDGTDWSVYDGQTGTASITVSVNSPPTPGIFEMSPESGQELSELFSFIAFLWSDDDLPITYQFGFLSRAAGRLMPIQTRSESASVEAFLSAGDPSNSYQVQCVATIFDYLDANATVTQIVSVNETSYSTEIALELMSALVDETDPSPDFVFSTVSVVMGVVNKVNCTLAPNCSQLHREECAFMAHSCGECLSGYRGTLGASNLPCFSDIETVGTAARRLAKTRRLQSTSSCTTHDDCPAFYACTETTVYGFTRLQCALPSKSCPADCSGHGICSFMRTSNSAAADTTIVSECNANDFSCDAVCQCHIGYSGEACHVTDNDLAQKAGIREAAIGNLATAYNASKLGTSVDEVKSTLAALTEASLESTELSQNSSQVLLTLAHRIMNDVLNNSMELTYDQLGMVLEVIQAVAKVQEREKNLYLEKINATAITHLHQMVTTKSSALVDGPTYFTGTHLSGSYKLLYNGTEETTSIPGDASEDEMYAAITALPSLKDVFASSGATDMHLDVTRVMSAVEIEEYGSYYQAVHAVPGNYFLACPNEYTTCGFELLPPGDYIMLRDEVDGPYGDYHGRWYRVHSSYRPIFDSDFLPLAELEDFTVPTTYKGNVVVNTTILRWARGYSYHLHFSGSMVESNPWLIAPLSLSWAAGSPSLIPSFTQGTTLVIDNLDVPPATPNNTGIVQADSIKSLMASCSAAITNNMVSGQRPFQSVKAGLRLTSQVLSSTISSISTTSTQLLQTEVEAALGSSPFNMDLPMKGVGAEEEDEEVVVSVVAMDASLYEVPSDVASDIIYINMSSLPRYFEEDTTEARTFNISIPTAHQVNYAHPTLPDIITYCGDDDWESRLYVCEEVVMSDPVCAGWDDIDQFYDKTQRVIHTCNGTVGTIVSKCDSTYTAPTCDALLTGQEEGSLTVSSGCVMISHNEDSTTCSCPLSSSPGSSSRLRRLSAVNSSDSSGVEVNYVALAETVKDSFVETWTSTGDLDGDVVEDGWQVLVVVSTLLLAIIFSLFSANRLDMKDKLSQSDEKRKRDRLKKLGAKVGVEAPTLGKGKRWHKGNKKTEAHGAEEKKKKQQLKEEEEKKEGMFMDYDRRKHDDEHWNKVRMHVNNSEVATTEEVENFLMVEQSLPAVLRSKPFVERFVHELKCCHRWLCIVYFYSEDFPRSMRVLIMASNVIVVLFVQALTYELTNPDDGTCATYETADECLMDSSTFDPSVSKCTWRAKRYGGTCSFREPEDTLSIVIFVAILSALVSIPLLVTIEWLVKNILSAKTSSASDVHDGSMYAQYNEKIERKQLLADRKKSAASVRRAKKERKRPPSMRGAGDTGNVSPHLQSSAGSAPQASSPSVGGLAVGRQRQRRRSSLLTLLSYQNAQQSVLTSTTQDDLGRIIEGIRTYRHRLSTIERVDFDGAWGLDSSSGQFRRRSSTFSSSRFRRASGAQGNRAWLSDMAATSDIQDRITEDVNEVREKVEDEYHAMTTQPSMSENVYKGKNLMLLFQHDLLPGTSGQVLKAKSRRDAKWVNTVHPLVKLACWVFIVFLILVMLFYVYLFSLNQTRARQGAWLKSFIIWLILEVVVVSTVICFVTHFLIPSVIMKDLHKVKERLLNVIRDYRESIRRDAREKARMFQQALESTQGGRNEQQEDQEDKGFNAAAYLFVSYRLASLFPDLKESKIIKKFHSPWPRTNYSRAQKDVKQSYNVLAMSIGRSVAMVVFQLLGELVSLPVSIQDMILNFISTSVVGYTMLLHVSLYQMMPVLVAVPTVMVVLVVHFFVRKNDHDRKVQLARTMPITGASCYRTPAGGKWGDAADPKHSSEAGRAEAVPVQALTTEVLMDLERKRRNAYARDATDYEVAFHNHRGDGSRESTSGSSSSNGEYRRISLRTSLKRDSLASLDSADRFSDISYDPAGGSPLTIGAAHYLNSGISPSLESGINVLGSLREVQEEQLAQINDLGSQKYEISARKASDDDGSSSDDSAISDATSSSGELHLQLATIGNPGDPVSLSPRAGRRRTKFPKYLDADKKREEEEGKQAGNEGQDTESKTSADSSSSGRSEVSADAAQTSDPAMAVRRKVSRVTSLTQVRDQEYGEGDPETAHPRAQPVFSAPRVASPVEVRTTDPISPARTPQAAAPSFSQWQILQSRMEALERNHAELCARRENTEQHCRGSLQNASPDRNEVMAHLAALEQRKKDLEVKKNSPPGTADSSTGTRSLHATQRTMSPKVSNLLATRADSHDQRRAKRPLVVSLDDIKDDEDTTSASYQALDDLDNI